MSDSSSLSAMIPSIRALRAPSSSIASSSVAARWVRAPQVWSNTSPDSSPKRVAFVAAALAAFKPTDELEGLLAAQGVALHLGAMECLRRAMLPDQHPDIAAKLRKDGANLARGMTDMLEALDRKRGKGPQVVRVERVVVHEGGQAIVGNVQPAAPKAGVG